MAPPAWAYEVDNFTPSPDKEFICSICQNVFCDPLMTRCSHVFCKHCITSWLTKNSNCPICREFTMKSNLKQIIPMLKNLISNLTLHCHNFKNGCIEILTIDGCEAHVQSCPYELIKCSNSPCTLSLYRMLINFHETESCPHIRFIPCDACDLIIPARDSGKHDCIRALKKIIETKEEIVKKKDDIINNLQKILQKERIGHSRNYDITQSIEAVKLIEKQLQPHKSYEEISTHNFDSRSNFSLITHNVYEDEDKNIEENLSITEMIKKDIKEWRNSNMWRFTCYGPVPYIASFPDFRDVSFEEHRLEYLQAKENNTDVIFVSNIRRRALEVSKKRLYLEIPDSNSIYMIKNFEKALSSNADLAVDEKNETYLKNIIHDVNMEPLEKSMEPGLRK